MAKRRTPTRPPQPAPASLTGGAGFRFEDRVGAWAAAALLAGGAPLGTDFGPLSTISFQENPTIEPLDDLLLLSCEQPAKRFTASVKSFDMLDKGKLEASFVGAAWRRRLAGDFDAESELLGFVSAGTGQDAWRSLSKLVNYARGDDPDRLAVRLGERGRFNETDRGLWESAALPDEVAREISVTGPISPGLLFGCLMPLRLDFDQPNSQAAVEALEWCDRALAPGQTLGPEDLWEALLKTVSQVRPDGGMLNWASLMGPLRRFALALRPDARHDWALLDTHTLSALASVRTELGAGLHLPRTAALEDLGDHAALDNALLISGPPGCGKSALTAAWSAESPARALMLRTWDLDGGLAELRTRLGLRSAVLDSLRLSERPVRIVIDGLDNDGETAHFAAAAELTRAAAELPNVRVLVTCNELALGRVFDRLRSAGAQLAGAPVMLGNLGADELGEVLAQREDLRQLAEAGNLASILDRPKLLDLVLQVLDRVGPQPLTGTHDEAAIADVWWSRIASSGKHRAQRVELLTGLAVNQADALRSTTAVGDLGALGSFAAVADELRDEGILAADERRYVFAHELFADWARLEWLRGRDDSLAALDGKSKLPTWHRAVRLTALSLLREQGVAAWSAARARLADGPEPLLGELFLDAPLLAADAESVLEQLWPQLIAENGALLNRALNRFWSVASIADPRHEQLTAGLPQLAAHLAATARLPLQSLWPSVLRVLARHAAEAVSLAPGRVADLVNLWLRSEHPVGVGDRDAGELGVALMVRLSEQTPNVVYEEEFELKLWRAALAAGAIYPEQVCDAARAVLDDHDPHDEGQTMVRAGDPQMLRGAVFVGDTLVPLAAADAEVAADIALRCALTPGSRTALEAWIDVARQLEIADGRHDLIALPETGPFYHLLQIAPDHGLRVIVGIVEHATACWADGGGVHRDRDALDGRTFEMLHCDRWVPLVGDIDVMHWHRGHSTTPALLASALMALERWLYDRIEADKNIDAVLEQILESGSLALIGVAVEIACFRPELLLGPLQPLISSAGVLLADRLYKLHSHLDLDLAGAHMPPARARLALWNAMPHRAIVLDQLLMASVLNGIGLADELGRARTRWAQSDTEGWRYLLAQTDPAHYTLRDTPDGQRWQVALPDNLQEEVKRDQPEHDHTVFWISFPQRLRDLLNATNVAIATDPEALWNEVQAGLASQPPADLAEMGMRVREDATCALAAVLIIRHGDWLAEHPDHATWCRNQLVTALANPPRDFIAGPDDPADDRWDTFCAEAIPALLNDDPGDLELRCALVRLIASPRLQRVQITFRRMSALPALAEDLGRLEHLSLYAAQALAWQAERSHREELARQGWGGPRVEDLPDLAAAFEHEAERFVSGEISPITPLLSNFLAATPDGLVRAPDRRDRLALALSPDYLLAANGHRLWPQNATEPERTRRFAFAIDLAVLLAQSLRASESDRRPPQQKERWQRQLLSTLGAVTASLPAQEGTQLWEPLIALGDQHGAGFATYLHSLWSQLLAADPTPADASALIARLLTACESRDWAQTPTETVLAVAGIDGYRLDAWKGRHWQLLASVQTGWEKWLEPHARSPFIAEAIAHFAARAAADHVRPTLLAWLAEVAPHPTGQREQLDAALGELLTWLQAKTGLLRELSPEGEDARAILAALVGRGDRLAITLSEQLRQLD